MGIFRPNKIRGIKAEATGTWERKKHLLTVRAVFKVYFPSMFIAINQSQCRVAIRLRFSEPTD